MTESGAFKTDENSGETLEKTSLGNNDENLLGKPKEKPHSSTLKDLSFPISKDEYPNAKDIVFLHIGKTGGTSFDSALSKLHKLRPDLEGFRKHIIWLGPLEDIYYRTL